MADNGYIEAPLTSDPDALAETALAYLADNIPGWVPRDAAIEVWLVQALARLVADAKDTASAVPASIFRYFGRSVVLLLPIDAAAASVPSTWTMHDAAGYTVGAGTVVGFRTAGDVLVPFRTRAAFTVAPGSSVTAPGAVMLDAMTDGTDGNGHTGPMELLDPLAFVDSVTATAASAGGTDAESDATYLDRLREELRLLTPRPILAVDYAVLARRTPGVYRALGINNLIPEVDDNAARAVTVAPVGSDGEVVGAPVKAALEAALDGQREVNFIVSVIDPSYTVVNVVTHFVPEIGVDNAATALAVEAAVTTALSPAVWGGGADNPPHWDANSRTVRYLAMAALIGSVPGVAYVSSLTLNGGTIDLVLTGYAPLTRPGTITATAVS